MNVNKRAREWGCNMAKNPLWILGKLGPVVFDYVPSGYHVTTESNYWIALLDWGESVDILNYYIETKPATERVAQRASSLKLVQLKNLLRPDFIRYALDTLPRNSVEYHALLMFLRYYG